MSETESKADQAWNWFLRFLGAGVFAYGALVPKGEVGYFYGFIGIALAVLPINDFRMLIRSWRRNGSGKESP